MSKWPMVPLGEVLRLDLNKVSTDPSASYPVVGVYSYAKGLFDREVVNGSNTSYKYYLRLSSNHVVMSQLFGWEGAIALSSDQFAGKFVSPQFPTFLCDTDRLDRRYLFWSFSRPAFWNELGSRTTGMGDRRRTLNPTALFLCEIPLPTLTEQRRLVERIDALTAKIEEAQKVTSQIEVESQGLLEASFMDICQAAPRRRLGDIAPLNRRPAAIDPLATYPGVSVRSFGRGTFHNPPLPGSEITWEKPFKVCAGDILVSNIKAWEGAIAVAKPEDDGRYGSHRYLTYTPLPGIATARFVCFYLLTKEGLHYVGEASPGSADRNRTTSAKALLEIPVPVPDIKQQEWFGKLYDKVEEVKQLQQITTAGRDAMLPAILDRAFRGEL